MSTLHDPETEPYVGVQFRGTELAPEVDDGDLIVFATDRCPWWPGSTQRVPGHTQIVWAECTNRMHPWYMVRRLQRTPRGWALTARGLPPVWLAYAGDVIVTATAVTTYDPQRH